ncbi:MAG: 4-hydroxy-tetrahydrodipicolinate synthase, partial [Calditrichaeota bacterium]|nr:4-hydroxy-tetrahydrodipicolinate synthase [Calditrichota bacterium]
GMKNEELNAKGLRGVWTALVTPFIGERVNYNRLINLVELAAKAGLTGIVPLGSTGESASLDEKERIEVIKTAVNAADNKLKVMVGAGTNNTSKTIANIKQAHSLGADAALVVTPYYNKPTPEGLKHHFLTVADVSPIPIVLYHIPSRCGVGIPLDLVVTLSEHPHIIGIKEAGGDVWRSGEIARLTDNRFAVLSGDDTLTLPLMSVGAIGVISVISNLAPKLFHKMIEHCLKNDFKSALRIHQKLSPVLDALGMETNPAPIKEAMNIFGLKAGKVRTPLVPVRPATRRAIRCSLEQLGTVK